MQIRTMKSVTAYLTTTTRLTTIYPEPLSDCHVAVCINAGWAPGNLARNPGKSIGTLSSEQKPHLIGRNTSAQPKARDPIAGDSKPDSS